MTQIDNGFIDYKRELIRKSIHLCSLSMPIIYYFISRELAIKILIPITVFSVLLDFGRHIIPSVGKFFYRWFGFLLRKHEIDSEKKNLSGASYVFISALLCVYIFPKVIFITAFSTLILSDIAAALIGRRFGKHKFLFKSLEGTLAFFVVACIIVLVTPKVANLPTEYLIGFVAAAVGALAENVSYGWADDNLAIPLSMGAVMWLMYSWLLPGMELVLKNSPL
ncbi:MAG: dolichol kinase [Ignavibacteria bacterium]|nr:MAG: dolichol kinase [Ignavibacteria bacterium]